MTRHRRYLAALGLAFTLITAGLTLGSSSPAGANDLCAYEDRTPPAITGFGPTTVTLGLEPEPVKFSVQAQDECGISGWSIDTPERFLFFVYQESPSDTVVPFRNKDAGLTAADVRVSDQAYNVQKRRFTFQLLRQTRWQSANAGPEPVDKGARVTVKGTLQRADWIKKKYVRYGGTKQSATVQFKARGSNDWIPVKTVEFASTGRIKTQVTVKREVARDGWYRLHFAGTANSSPSASAPDYVDVREP
jgi:hypothetical protein